MAGLSSPPVEELPAPMDRSTELPLEEQCGPAGEADVEHQAKAFLDAPPSLLILQKAAGADTVMGSETVEVWQLHKCWDNVSRVGGEFLMSPRSLLTNTCNSKNRFQKRVPMN
ncbi:uncharacterized protein ACIBXB_002884 [Morphnus guianensis]